MELKFYNTLKHQKELFSSINKKLIKFYSCGPTVYDFAHLGHFRAYIFVDTLRRVLRYHGYKLNHVMNITDVGHLTDDADAGEDKMEKKAAKEKKTVWEIAKFYIDDFFKAMDLLNNERPEIICKATDHISEMIDLIKLIEKNGYTYKISDGIYFNTSKLSDYGKIAQLNLDALKEGARVEPNPEKKNPTDFALWKFSYPHLSASKSAPISSKRQMEWKSPWGLGFPGWHIECTAMGVKYLGTDIDIHTGGIDHIPVHHTNEIAQAQAAFGKDIVKYWLHNEFVLVDGEKMSKSKGNFYTMSDIQKRGFNPLAVRYFFLQAHYRSPVNFTWEGLEAAGNGLKKLYEKVQSAKCKVQNYSSKLKVDTENKYYINFHEAINDDLNTAKGLSVLWELLKDESISNNQKTVLILKFDKVLGLKLTDVKPNKTEELPEEIKKLADERQTARELKDYKLSDKLRREIEKKGYEVQDTTEGQIIKFCD